ncbi:hypothetical protein B0H63DRAFT_499751 [Podospora didyma]|uniref:Uncharacterized protein n=1 Tax=Podospora didyma TaxID=330526 RepID=A0AAE0NYG5_9PEZI|nr:hypothetical protein B0H63DRAFT_499751 [Podospora didyma]
MANISLDDVARELHIDLRRMALLSTSSGAPSLPNSATACMKAGAADGVVLKHAQDASVREVYKIIPAWNLKDVTEEADFLLDMLEYRTSTDLQIQCGERDLPWIRSMMQTRNLRSAKPFKNKMTMFLEEETRALEETIQTMNSTGYEVCVPRATGELILNRQKEEALLASAVSKLSLKPRPVQQSLPELVAIAQDQKNALEAQLALFSSHPVVLAHGLLPDEKGRSLPVHADKYISAAAFDTVHDAVKQTAIWNYLRRLLELLGSTDDKVFRPIILQELSNICNLEYERAQSSFRRQAQTFSGGNKWFKRMSNAYNKAVNARLSDLHTSHPLKREKLEESEADALCDLAVIIGFIHDLSPGLEGELNKIKKDLDLRDFAVPIDNLLQPGMAEGALNTFEQFVVEKAGTKMGFLYQDLIEECLSDLDCQHEQSSLTSASNSAGRRRKTRPSDSSAFEIAPLVKSSPELDKTPAKPAETFKVGASTAEVFSSLSTMTAQKPFTVHRPHKSHIEGYSIPIYEQRLNRAYRWGGDTFQTA